MAATHGEGFCARLCRFNAELMKGPGAAFQHLDEWVEIKGVLYGDPRDVSLAFVSLNLMVFWLEVIGEMGSAVLQSMFGSIASLLIAAHYGFLIFPFVGHEPPVEEAGVGIVTAYDAALHGSQTSHARCSAPRVSNFSRRLLGPVREGQLKYVGVLSTLVRPVTLLALA